MNLRKISDRVYQGHVHIGETTGLFRIRPLQESAAFPETGFYKQNQESHDYGTNEVLLKQISALTGGRFNPRARAGFRCRRPDDLQRLAVVAATAWARDRLDDCGTGCHESGAA